MYKRQVLHSDLALAIRTQIVHLAVLAHLGQALCQLVSQTDGHRHQRRGCCHGGLLAFRVDLAFVIYALSLIHILGEITTNCYVDFQKVVREVVADIGYTLSLIHI